MGHEPGVALKWNYDLENEVYLNAPTHMLADERGMSYLNAAYPRKDSLEKVNTQGFLATFDYDTSTISSFKAMGKK